MVPSLRRVAQAIGLLLLGGLLAGCIIEEPRGSGWCYWHVYACR